MYICCFTFLLISLTFTHTFQIILKNDHWKRIYVVWIIDFSTCSEGGTFAS
nr:MAG TPA: cellulase [Caudoviricetes sp.]